jgi:hypothetical protein
MIFLKRLKNEKGSILNHPNMIKKNTTNVTIGQYFPYSYLKNIIFSEKNKKKCYVS